MEKEALVVSWALPEPTGEKYTESLRTWGLGFKTYGPGLEGLGVENIRLHGLGYQV